MSFKTTVGITLLEWLLLTPCVISNVLYSSAYLLEVIWESTEKDLMIYTKHSWLYFVKIFLRFSNLRQLNCSFWNCFGLRFFLTGFSIRFLYIEFKVKAFASSRQWFSQASSNNFLNIKRLSVEISRQCLSQLLFINGLFLWLFLVRLGANRLICGQLPISSPELGIDPCLVSFFNIF